MQHVGTRCRLGRSLYHSGNAGLQTSHDLLASGSSAGGGSYSLDVVQYVANVLWVKGQNLWRLCQAQTAFCDLTG
jgi:hypothetical protein